MAKNLLAILAALCLVAAIGSVGASAVVEYDPESGPALYTSAYGKGEFNILVIPDAHQTAIEDSNLIAYISAAIKSTADVGMPLDLIIFLGDSVTGSACANPAAIATAVGRLLAPVKAAKIPYTLVFGNHDLGDAPAGAITGPELLRIWRDAGGTIDFTYDEQVLETPATDTEDAVYIMVPKTVSVPLFAQPTAAAGDGLAELFEGTSTVVTPGITGTTNFMYTISKNYYIDTIYTDGRLTHAPVNKNGGANTFDHSEDYAQLFLFDIGSKNAGQDGYPYVRTDQLTWFTASNDAALPAYVFQHIPLPEVYSNCFFLKSPFNWALPGTRNILEKNYFGTANFINMVGTVLEAPNPPKFSDGEFQKITAPGNVQAAFFGHDHMNNFVEKFPKIDLVQLPGAAWNGSYGTYLVRGGTFVSIHPNAASTGVTYSSNFFTYRQASRVGGYGGISTTNGFKDWIQIVPFLLQNLMVDVFAPLRWILGGF